MGMYDEPQITKSYGGCRCACHFSKYTKHIMACCHPADDDDPIYVMDLSGII